MFKEKLEKDKIFLKKLIDNIQFFIYYKLM